MAEVCGFRLSLCFSITRSPKNIPVRTCRLTEEQLASTVYILHGWQYENLAPQGFIAKTASVAMPVYGPRSLVATCMQPIRAYVCTCSYRYTAACRCKPAFCTKTSWVLKKAQDVVKMPKKIHILVAAVDAGCFSIFPLTCFVGLDGEAGRAAEL